VVVTHKMHSFTAIHDRRSRIIDARKLTGLVQPASCVFLGG
jgi:hypothetical protein